ncbi:uncharacterized protein LOC135226622 [Macrobrachium nipponense]|uniref:uncharacterized protein LOC135226622 n=1 Tax=Macrobrachium nipponense TaxID=159736 RepID=UPI0030C7A4AE
MKEAGIRHHPQPLPSIGTYNDVPDDREIRVAWDKKRTCGDGQRTTYHTRQARSPSSWNQASETSLNHEDVSMKTVLAHSCGCHRTSATTRCPEAVPMAEASTSPCTEALLSSWMSSFGVLENTTTDRGLAFLFELWVSLAPLMGTALHSTMAYYPAANGRVERVHHSLKAALIARCTNENWKVQLPWVLLGLRTAPKANGEDSPAENVYREALAVPGKFFPMEPDNQDMPLRRLREIAKEFAPWVKTFTDRTHNYSPEGLGTCTHIFLRDDAHHSPHPDLAEAHTMSSQETPSPPSLASTGRKTRYPSTD